MHHARVSKEIDFSPLFNNPTFSDFLFEFEGNQTSCLYCHKVILNLNDFYKSLFQTDTLEVHENKMKINDDPNLFTLLIKSLYFSNLELKFGSLDELLPLILLADKYQFLYVRDRCIDLLSRLISAKNCALIWLFSNSKGFLTTINEQAAKVLKKHYFWTNMVDAENDLNNLVFDFNAEEMKLFIETFVTSVTDYGVLLSVIVKWVDNDKEARGNHLFNILQSLGNKRHFCPIGEVVWLTSETKTLGVHSNSESCLFGSERFSSYQKVQFSVLVDFSEMFSRSGNKSSVVIGIASDNHSSKIPLGRDSNGYGFLPFKGLKVHDNTELSYSSKTLLKAKEQVSVNLPGDGTVEFLINGQSLGTAFEKLPRNVLFRPAVSAKIYSVCSNFYFEFV